MVSSPATPCQHTSCCAPPPSEAAVAWHRTGTRQPVQPRHACRVCRGHPGPAHFIPIGLLSLMCIAPRVRCLRPAPVGMGTNLFEFLQHWNMESFTTGAHFFLPPPFSSRPPPGVGKKTSCASQVHSGQFRRVPTPSLKLRNCQRIAMKASAGQQLHVAGIP